MTGREALLDAFDHLFEKSAAKLQVEWSPEDRAEAKRDFSERFSGALEIVEQVSVHELPADVLSTMEHAIDEFSPAQMVGYLAAIPLAQHTQEMLRTIAYRAAEKRLLEHLASHADDKYGGN